jgi:uncharacterized integral membrane protein
VAGIYLLVAVVGAAIAVFVLQNKKEVDVVFLAWQMKGALSLVVLLSFLSGIVLTSLVGLVSQWRLRRKIRQLESRLAKVPSASAEAPPPTTTARVSERAGLDL